MALTHLRALPQNTRNKTEDKVTNKYHIGLKTFAGRYYFLGRRDAEEEEMSKWVWLTQGWPLLQRVIAEPAAQPLVR
jgi:hypothetical protein